MLLYSDYNSLWMLFSFWSSKNPGKALEKSVKQPWKTLDFWFSEDVRTLSPDQLLQTQIILPSTHLINCSKPKSFFHLPTWSIAPNPNHSSIYPPDQLLQTQTIPPSTHQINYSKLKSFFHLPTRSIAPNPNRLTRWLEIENSFLKFIFCLQSGLVAIWSYYTTLSYSVSGIRW